MNGTVVYYVLMYAGAALVLGGLFLTFYRDHKISRQGDLIAAVGYLGVGMAAMIAGKPLGSAICAALAAYFLWHWWNGGGGDGLKRRFKTVKTWAASFGPKTAPQGA